MQQAQDQLDFNIETPSDAELMRRYERGQKWLTELNKNLGSTVFSVKKKRNRKTKHEKKMERLARAELSTEIEEKSS